jgi:small subunit ribosomal protein S29
MERSGGPAAVIRQSTVDLARLLDKGKDGSSKDSRHVLCELHSCWHKWYCGPDVQLVKLVVGKACYCSKARHMPARAVGSYSTSREVSPVFVYNHQYSIQLMHVASEWIESKSQYQYNSSSKSFTQPALASTILSSLLTINPTTLKSITTKSPLGSFKAGTSIAELCQSAKINEAVEVLEGVLETLGKQSQVPVLIAVDEVQALFATSGVRTPDYKILESYHLSTPKLILDYLTGKKALVSRRPLFLDEVCIILTI